MTSDHIIAIMTLDIAVTIDISQAALLTQSPVIWLEEHLLNINVLQRKRLSNVG
jgi:hypothetical protein